MPQNSVAIIAAGGRGSRMGLDIPKQYAIISDAPVIVHTIRAFSSLSLKRILVLVPEDHLEYTKKLLSNYGVVSADVLCGGETRNDTIQNAVKFLHDQGELDDDTVLITHDSVRPFVTKRLILECIESARKNGACTAAIPAVDTIVKADSFVNGILNRSELMQVQTPQAFNAKLFEKVCASLDEQEKALATDCTRLFTLAGEKVAVVKGESFNLKLTYKTDLAIAKALFDELSDVL